MVIVVTYASFFYLQMLHEQNLTEALLRTQRQRQELLVTSITQNIASDLDSALLRLRAITHGPELSTQTFNNTLRLQLSQLLSEIRNTALYDELFIIYKNYTGIMVTNSDNSSNPYIFSSFDSEKTEWKSKEYFSNFIDESFDFKRPLFSYGYSGAGDKWRIAFTTPIFDSNKNEYIGLVGVSIPTFDLVNRYGNIVDTTKQRLVFFDKNATLLAGYPLPASSIGNSMFSANNQKILSDSGRPAVNQLFRNVLSGKLYSAELDLGDGPRLVTGHSILADGTPTYFLNIPTPFKQILSPIQTLVSRELLLNLVLLAAFTAAMIYLVWNMARWGTTLSNEVKKRTQQLEYANTSLRSKTNELEVTNESLNKSNTQLSEANERLKLHDKLQKDFVNIAAHELRTPAQSIIGYAELLNQSETRNRKYEETLLRNADRLYRLSADILDVARIESETLKLHKSEFDINEKIKNVINDVSQASKSILEKKKVDIIFKPKESILMVYADKVRIFEVISNLLNNAIKFTDNGTITFTAEKNLINREAIVTITDSGSGIVPELLPTIFERFTGKSVTGMGVGLYITKSIVEAHGGKIQACNNSEGKGATFTFTLPLQRVSDNSTD